MTAATYRWSARHVRKDEIPDSRANWPHIVRKGSSYPWTTRKLGEMIGLKF